jgi:hypothetical protein
MSETASHVAAVARAVHKADARFGKSGGSSRHWVVERFLPALEEEGLHIGTTGEVERGFTRAEVEAILTCVNVYRTTQGGVIGGVELSTLPSRIATLAAYREEGTG